ncbi:hypothetical protein SLE2022_299330 [Rubroshorea leprosula]
MADQNQKPKLVEKSIMPETKRIVIRRLEAKNTGIEEPNALDQVDSDATNDANSSSSLDCKVVRHSSNDGGQEDMYLMKLEATRRKLKERYVEIQEAGRKKKIRIIDFKDISERLPPPVEPTQRRKKIKRL